MSLRTVARAGLLLMAGVAAVAMYHLATRGASGTLSLAGSAALLLCLPVVPIVSLRWVRPRTTVVMLLTRRARARRDGCRAVAFTWVDLDDIARVMWLAAVAAEDTYFRHHGGFDWESIRAARAHNRNHVHKRGGSTITQQVAKNLFLWPARSYVRKAVEAYLAMLLEAFLAKRRILELYLNVAQFGEGVFGVQAAARRYFAKPAADLDRQEAALLAAALPNPARYRVSHPSHQLRFRQVMVLAAMQRLGNGYLEHL